ncbi:MAG: hypothetical protein HYY06_07795 [Deltaproteobacteria bacterium]|nr:hypothetical protein [Deltaproteobacteria bacterium]
MRRPSLLCLLLLACSSPRGLWRDQLVFVGDHGMVVPLGLVRETPGSAEAKGWLGQDGVWRSVFYDRFAIRGQDAPDLGASVAAWSRWPDRSAYVSLARKDREIDLRVRTRSAPESMTIRARAIRRLGDSRDPEGSSLWSAGRAEIRGVPRARREGTLADGSGWLLVEQTPADRPKRPLVEYGDYVLAFLARKDGDLVILKRSRKRGGFDFAVARLDGRVAKTRRVVADVGQDHLSLALPDEGLRARLDIRDRDESHGVAPNGRAVTYETLLLGGDLNGVAMVIR